MAEPMEGNAGVKRKLVDVAKDYAKEIQEEETILPACVHAVNVLTLQHDVPSLCH